MRKSRLFLIVAGLALVAPTSAVADDTPGSAKFEFFGTAGKAKDPTDLSPINHVISMDTTAGTTFGVVRRPLGVQAPSLDDHLALEYYLDSISCFGGSPRFQLAVDLGGDGVSDGNAFGYIGPSPNFTGCPMDVWQFEDLTDTEKEWDLGQLGLGQALRDWDEVEVALAAFPLHSILRGSLVQDTFAPIMSGVAYYDDVHMGDRVLNGPEDTIGS